MCVVCDMLNYTENCNCPIKAKTEMTWQFFEKFSDIKFQENVSISFKVFHMYRETAWQIDWVNLMAPHRFVTIPKKKK
jgi:hypothetical protein